MLAALDSNFIIDFLNGEAPALEKIGLLKSMNAKLCTTVFNYHEVMRGFMEEPYMEKKGIAEILFSTLTIINYLPADAKAALGIEKKLKSKGRVIGDFDTMIAAICLNSNATLITRNIKHFQRVPGLKIESWKT
jgi:predicted nucleic acid-binding protein